MVEQRDDDRLTAYALGELETAERERVEALLATSAEARETVESTRVAAAALRAALASEPTASLTPAQRARLEATLRQPRLDWGRIALLGGTMAATVAVVVAISTPSLLRARIPAPARESGQPRAVLPSEFERLKALGYVVESPAGSDRPVGPSRETYAEIRENAFVPVAVEPRSTFSIDVDTASYSLVRRFLSSGQRPPLDAVRIEEMVNYFPYADLPPEDGPPFAVHLDVADCPWAPAHRLVRIALKGREVPREQRPPSNLVFLLDVSGSMDEPDKLPLVKRALRLLVEELGERDRVAIVVYAGAEGIALPSTSAADRGRILEAIENLAPAGATHGSAGIRLAYEVARAGFVRGGVNRVILATDGDFNVGVTNAGDLARLIEQQAKSGVFLTTLGFGRGNLNDQTLETLADRGNGHYAYIDGLAEARRVLVEQAGGTLVTIAKDVKLQVEFNPARVQAYRLIGYENRLLATQDFADDAKDAGEIGAGHGVTALYEIVPAGAAFEAPSVDPLRYQAPARATTAHGSELLLLKLRYKEPEGATSVPLEVALPDREQRFDHAPADFRFAAAVASFGMQLRDSKHRGSASLADVLTWARASLGADPGGQRKEFVSLVEQAQAMELATR